MVTLMPLRFRDGLVLSSVECWRWWGYMSWIFTFALGIIITKADGGLDVYLNEGTVPPAFNATFGTFNICLFFDIAPANMVLPVVYAFDLCIWLGYFVSLNLLIRAHFSEGIIGQRTFTYLILSHRFEAATAVAFSLIWAVSPINDLEDRFWKAALWIHSAPYLGLQVGLCALATSNCVHQHSTGYWSKYFSARVERHVAYAQAAYCALFVFNIYFTIPLTCYGLAQGPWIPPHAFKKVLSVADASVFIFGLILPLVKATLTICASQGKLISVV